MNKGYMTENIYFDWNFSKKKTQCNVSNILEEKKIWTKPPVKSILP